MIDIIGIDEVGRGCWAGPMAVAAVRLREPLQGLKDSKKLSALQRQRLADEIRQKADVAIGWVSPIEIDRLGLTKAEYLAILRALRHHDTTLPIILDGKHNFLANRHPHAQAIVGADNLEPAVSAASIVAKVARDFIMSVYGAIYPAYGFERHVGYGTLEHSTALKQHGVTAIHRQSYKPIQSYL